MIGSPELEVDGVDAHGRPCRSCATAPGCSADGGVGYARPMLTLEELRGGRRGRAHRHRRDGDDGHAGPAAGQAARRARVRARHRRARGGGLQLPARRRRRHDAAAGLRDDELGARLRRLRVPPRPRDAAARDAGSRARRSCLCDLEWHDGTPVAPSPRQILRRAARRGWPSAAGRPWWARSWSSSSSARRTPAAPGKGYRGLVPANEYNVDYSHPRHDDGRGRAAPDPARTCGRRACEVEDSKGECNLGQHEVNFRYRDALRMADEHAIYKTAAKEIAHQHGAALTFIAKYDEREGNSCHIHCSFWDGDRTLFPAADGHAFSPLYRSYVAGQIERTARARVLLRAERQLVQALRVRLVRADRRWPGATTTAPARSAPSGTATACGWRAAWPAATSTRTSRSPPSSRRASTASTAGSSSARPSRATPTTPTCRACRRACPRPIRGLEGSVVRARGVRRRGRRPLPQRRAPRAARLRGGRHRLGAAPWLRAARRAACGR